MLYIQHVIMLERVFNFWIYLFLELLFLTSIFVCVSTLPLVWLTVTILIRMNLCSCLCAIPGIYLTLMASGLCHHLLFL